jgi:hypothetical protein
MLLLAGLATVWPAAAQTSGAATGGPAKEITGSTRACEVPAYLTATDSAIGRVTERVKAGRSLDILVIGSGSSTLNGPEGAAAAYPARLQAYLAQRLPGVTVNVTTDLHPRQTAEEVAEVLDKMAADRKPVLVIWQTGTVDALKSVDTDDFRGAIKDGVTALKARGADVILMNPQYNPRMETMVSVSPYVDTMRVVAQELDVPLFDRFSVMRHWTEVGDFDLGANTHSPALAKSVHDCVGHALADMVMEAAHLDPAELRTQK